MSVSYSVLIFNPFYFFKLIKHLFRIPSLIIPISEGFKSLILPSFISEGLTYGLCFSEDFLIFAHEFISLGTFCENYFEAKVVVNFFQRRFTFIFFVSVLWPFLV